MKVIQISGLKGIFMAVFVITCLAAGFIAFPSIVAMHLWNYAAKFIPLPLINVYQGVMLWAITAITGFIINDRNKYLIAYRAPMRLSDAEMAKLMERIKLQSRAAMLNSMVLKEIKPVEKTDKDENKKENV